MIATVELSDLGVVSVRGPDARAFLQGQLTNDLDLLSAERSIVAALANAQGRVIHLVRVLAWDDAVFLCLPGGDASALRDHLARYVLRARVELRDESAAWRGLGILGIADQDQRTLAQRLGALGARPGGVSRHGDLLVLAIDAQRIAVLAPTSALDRLRTELRVDAAPLRDWLLADIRSGLPAIAAATRALFVPQVINLDLLGGISFTKGCYTGQEIVARAQHLGRIKRRMLRARGTFAPPVPGSPVLARGDVSGHVVRSVSDEHGACELLATVSLADRDQPLTIGDGAPLELLSLPYVIPELGDASAAR
jgi:folate-binding protein YgfZ